MNVRIRHLAVVFIVLYAVLFVQLNRWQVFGRDALVSDPRNNRVTVRSFNATRGPIVTADGVAIANTVKVDTVAHPNDRFQFQRNYPTGDLFANISGYYTLGFGATQLERVYTDILAGSDPRQQVNNVGDLFSGADLSGSVHLTVRNDLQNVAKQALADREGSAVVLDPRTGAVLAMYSNPTFNPNEVAQHNSAAASAVLTALQDDPRKPLLANAYQERYMPGSAFKVLTTSIGIEAGVLNMLSTFPNAGKWVPPNTDNPIQNYGKKICGGDLAEVFRRSCNIPFAQTAVTLGPQVMSDGLAKFGMEKTIPFDLPGATASTFGGTAESFTDSLALLAIHGFGQGSVQMVPLHMAAIAGAVANGGVMMTPHVVADTRTHDDVVLNRTQPTPWTTPMTPATASTLTQLMIGVVNDGTASCCLKLQNGVQAAAKTGTAQLNAEGKKQRSHAWIIAFAPAAAPRVAVAVMLKGVNDTISAGTGGKLAGPVAQALLNAALRVIP
ncbi:MAG: hypothetical protein JHC65_01030 [Ilumatobacteraceae bacterium]|nr:hypothetical protein [Ilumatobacteraceae bacterium]